MDNKVRSLRVHGGNAVITVKALGFSRNPATLAVSGEDGAGRVVLKPAKRSFGSHVYELGLRKAGNLASLSKGVFRFYLGDSKEPLRIDPFLKAKSKGDGYSNTFYRDEDGCLALKISPMWGKGEKTAEERRENAVTAYAEFRKLPIQEDEIFFESMSTRLFNDNPRAIYEELAKTPGKWKLVWGLANEKTDIGPHGTAVRLNSLEYWRHLATAKYIVSNINQYRFEKRPGQVVVNTMHGIPFKHMGLMATKNPETRAKMSRVFEEVWDIFVTPCDYMTDILRGESYNYRGRFLELGYPRNDVLVQHAQDAGIRQRVRDALGVPKDKKLILYAPTFRSKSRLDIPLDLELMRRELSDEYVLAFRSHYLVKQFVDPSIYNDFVIDGHGVENTNDLLVGADVLITDYSSIMFDFSLMNRPMVLLVDDWKKYTKKRGTYFDMPKEYPGLVAVSSEEVARKVKDPAIGAADLQAFAQRFNQYETGHAARDVVEAIWG